MASLDSAARSSLAALALSLIVSAQTPTSCLGPKLFFGSGWSNQSFTSGGQTPMWQITNLAGWDVASADDQSNIPSIWHSDCGVMCTDRTFFARARGSIIDNESIGFVLGFSPGDATNPNADYLALAWNGSTKPAIVPGCAGAGTQQVGMRLLRVFGTPDPQEFWSQQTLNTPCSGPNSGVEVLASAANLGTTPWTRFAIHRFRAVLEPNRLRIWSDSSLEFDLTRDFTAYTDGFGYFNQGQAADYWLLHVNQAHSTTAGWTNYGAGVAGCNGVPALTMMSAPLIGTTPDLFVGNPGANSVNGALVWATAAGNRFTPAVGANLLIGSPVAAVTNEIVPAAGALIRYPIRRDTCLPGQEFFAQWICPDACAPNGWALSRGLHVVVGDR